MRGGKTMAKKIRMGVIGILAMVGLVLIASEPDPDLDWFSVMFWKTIAGLALWGLTYLLHQYWNKRGLLPEEDYEDEWV